MAKILYGLVITDNPLTLNPSTLDPALLAWFGEGMKTALFGLFVCLLMVGCGEPDLDDKETRAKIIAEAIDEDDIQIGGKEDEKLVYAPNQEIPYSGWVKAEHASGLEKLIYYKDGKKDGLYATWHENGQKKEEGNYEDGKKDGLWIEYNEDGTGLSRYTYEEGQIVEGFSSSQVEP